MDILLLILIPEFILGFIIGWQVIKNQDQKIVWKTLNRGEDVSENISNSNIVLLIILTVIGIFSLFVYSIAKKRYK